MPYNADSAAAAVMPRRIVRTWPGRSAVVWAVIHASNSTDACVTAPNRRQFVPNSERAGLAESAVDRPREKMLNPNSTTNERGARPFENITAAAPASRIATFGV